MEPTTLETIATLLAPFFTKAGETLATESIKLALEKRQDIKSSVVEIFKPEIISLGLTENQSIEQVKALLEKSPEVMAEIHKKLTSHSDLIKKLTEVLIKQEGRTITTTNYFEYVGTINIDQKHS